ncbi:unnamed protein product [Albugo candida]|uniref:Uncharacterized protein n=1 Tax=Albugo candida TaxID=65357 RepID=A0A024G5Q4_9STRA|nr:unnamed protein product [Albugo candida]|eukprot:CCI41868.1 unnamed protein product [Albugo candida]
MSVNARIHWLLAIYFATTIGTACIQEQHFYHQKLPVEYTRQSQRLQRDIIVQLNKSMHKKRTCSLAINVSLIELNDFSVVATSQLECNKQKLLLKIDVPVCPIAASRHQPVETGVIVSAASLIYNCRCNPAYRSKSFLRDKSVGPTRDISIHSAAR